MRSFPSLTYEVVVTDPDIGRFKFFLILGNDNGKLCFVDVLSSKVGSTMRGMLRSLASTIETMTDDLDKLKDLLNDWEEESFSPSGLTNDPEIPVIRSIPHYIAERIRLDFFTPATASASQA